MPTSVIVKTVFVASFLTAGMTCLLLLAGIASLSTVLLMNGVTLLAAVAIMRSLSGARSTKSIAHVLYDTERDAATRRAS